MIPRWTDGQAKHRKWEGNVQPPGLIRSWEEKKNLAVLTACKSVKHVGMNKSCVLAGASLAGMQSSAEYMI